MCLFPDENQQPVLRGRLFFRRKVTFFIGRETKHTYYRRKSTKKIANNNSTIWRGSVLAGEEPPHHSGELNRALHQVGDPTQSQLSALCLQDTTSPWGTDYGGNLHSKTLILMPALKFYGQKFQQKKSSKKGKRKHRTINEKRDPKSISQKKNMIFTIRTSRRCFSGFGVCLDC